jgi:hypothetical protein
MSMNQLAPSVVETIERFGNDIGVDARPGPDGAYTFLFSHWGALSIASSEDGAGALVTLARQPQRPDAGADHRLLELAGRDPTTQEFLHVGLAPDGSYVCAAMIDQRRFDLVALNEALERLVRAFEPLG